MNCIVFIAQSLDGYIADKKGGLDWLHSVPNPDQIDMGFFQLMEKVDAVVMGRKTYEVVNSFGGEWPYSKPVYVLSNSLQEIPEHLHAKVSLMKGKPQEVIEKLNRKGLANLYIDGGTTIQQFLKEGLIDELIITTIPILLGGGSSLFGELDNAIQLELISSQLFLNQLTQAHYRLKRD